MSAYVICRGRQSSVSGVLLLFAVTATALGCLSACVADGPKAGTYISTPSDEGAGKSTLVTVTLEAREGGVFQVKGVFGSADNVGGQMPISGTFYPGPRGLQARWTSHTGTTGSVDGRWNPDDKTLRMTLTFPGGIAIPATLKRKGGDSSRAVDLVFCIDSTGSMKSCIETVRTSTNKIMAELKAKHEDLRVRLVTFGDMKDPKPIVEWQFTTDTAGLQKQIEGINLTGGGDKPEAVYSGLLAAVNGNWRPGVLKIIVLMGDAPPNDNDPVKAADVQRRALEVDPADIYPIALAVDGRVDAEALTAFKDIAQRNRGEVLPLTNLSELPAKLTATVDKAVAAGIARPATPPPAGGAGEGANEVDLVVCMHVADGEPEGVSDTFGPMVKIWALMSFENMPPNTPATLTLVQPSGAKSVSKLTISGTGKGWAFWGTSRAGGYAPGAYKVVAEAGGRVLGTKAFTIGN